MRLLADGCRVIRSDEGEILSEGTRRYRRPIARASGAQQITQTISGYAPGRAPARINPSGEEVHYVVSGRGRCRISEHTCALEPGTAVYVPAGASFSIENIGPEELRLASVCCPEDERSYLTEAEARETATTGHAPQPTLHEREQKEIPTGDRKFKLLIDKSSGCERITQFIGFIPQSRAPYHHHPYEEAIYIIEGEGRVWTKDRDSRFKSGSSIYLPRGVSHCLENTGASNIRLLGVFHPSGSPAVRYEDAQS